MPKFSLKEARKAAEHGNWGHSVANYLAILKSYANKRSELKDEFLAVMTKFLADLPEQGQKIEFLQMIVEMYPSDPDLRGILAGLLVDAGEWELAGSACLTAIKLNASSKSDSESLLTQFNSIRSHFIDQWHFRMLNDRSRNSAYSEALRFLVDSNHKVLDIGSGTGLLSILAARAGSSQVYGCEESLTLSELSREIVENSPESERIKIIGKNSSQMVVGQDIPAKVDVVVTELMDAGFFGENIVGSILDARKRLLEPEGKVIPGKATVFGVIVESEDIRREKSCHSFGSDTTSGCVFNSLCCARSGPSSGQEPYTSRDMMKIPNSYRVLTESIKLTSINFNSVSRLEQISEGYTQEKAFTVIEEGRPDAIVAWFEVELVPGVVLSSWSISSIGTSSWEQAVFLIPSEEELSIGDQVPVEIHLKENWFHCHCPTLHPENTDVAFADSNQIIQLNDTSTQEMYTQLFRSYSKTHKTGTKQDCLDLSDCPMIPLLFAKTATMKVCSPKSSEHLLEYLSRENSELSNLVHGEEKKTNPYNVLTVSPIDRSGLLVANVLEDLAYYRLKYGIDLCLPNELKVWGQLVNSEELQRYTCLVSDANTLGIQISPFINWLRTSEQRDVCLQTLEYSAMSEPVQLLALDFNETLDPSSDTLPSFVSQERMIDILPTKNGEANASIIWFELTSSICEDFHITTNAPKFAFNVSAQLFSEPIICSVGKSLQFEVSLKKSSITVSFP